MAACYAFTAVALAGAALLRGMASPPFWLLWGAATLAMQREAALLRQPALPRGIYGAHFSHQVLLGGLLLLALVVGRAGTGGP